MSAQKMREMVRQIQGMNAVQAQAVLAVVSRKSARLVAKTLASALGVLCQNRRLPYWGRLNIRLQWWGRNEIKEGTKT